MTLISFEPMPFLYLNRRCPEHKQLKCKLLEEINKGVTLSIYEDGVQQIKSCDYYVDQKLYKKHYADTFLKILYATMDDFSNLLSVEKWTLDLLWHQKYSKNNFHVWHTHYGSCLSGVYYLETPEGSKGTEFLFEDKIYSPAVKEGDLVLFPGSVYHRAPKVIENDRTVIAFNLTLRQLSTKTM